LRTKLFTESVRNESITQNGSKITKIFLHFSLRDESRTKESLVPHQYKFVLCTSTCLLLTRIVSHYRARNLRPIHRNCIR